MVILKEEFARRARKNISWWKWVNHRHFHLFETKEAFDAYIMSEEVVVTKVNLIFADGQKTKKANQVLADSGLFTLETFGNVCIELIENGMNKSRGISVLSDLLKVQREKIIAFGDSENDREMLLYVGHAVAMGNADPSIKSIANVVADTNVNRGVAKELLKIYNLQNIRLN